MVLEAGGVSSLGTGGGEGRGGREGRGRGKE